MTLDALVKVSEQQLSKYLVSEIGFAHATFFSKETDFLMNLVVEIGLAQVTDCGVENETDVESGTFQWTDLTNLCWGPERVICLWPQLLLSFLDYSGS